MHGGLVPMLRWPRMTLLGHRSGLLDAAGWPLAPRRLCGGRAVSFSATVVCNVVSRLELEWY